MNASIYTSEECEKIAESSSLRYVNDMMNGIFRRRCGKGFSYYFSGGTKVAESQLLQRIRSLKIPPAYLNVWICRYANGHIQATGIDARGRKQYIYHPLWQKARQKQKFDSMMEFGKSLPLIRRKIKKKLANSIKLDKEQVICAIIYLLDNTHVRIGNSLYAKENKSYGATTLRKKHVVIKREQVVLNFMGKHAKLWHIVLTDKNIIKLIKKCEEIPGYEIFKYQEDGVVNTINSQDVNGYLQFITNYPFTAKDFRTWIGCRETLCHLLDAHCKKNLNPEEKIKETIKKVAKTLGHTPSVCQKSYIDPTIVAAWMNGDLEVWKEKYPTLSNWKKDRILRQWWEDHFDVRPRF